MTSTTATSLLSSLGISTTDPNPGVFDGEWFGSGTPITSFNPSTGAPLATVTQASESDMNRVLRSTRAASKVWRNVPAPERGRVLRLIRNALELKVDELGMLITLEMGKIATEGRGEFVEFLDVADYAVGLSRSIGRTVLPSERKRHFMTEVCHPLGVIGIISAFNFPMAVFGWNFSLALVTGNASIWKPSETTPLCSLAVVKIISRVLQSENLPGALCSLMVGDGKVGAGLVQSEDVDLVSFTGSEGTGRKVAVECASRFKQSLLELGGNNAAIVLPDANQDLALRSILFAALGTAGQRCTTTRRLLLHRSISIPFLKSLCAAFASAAKKTGAPEKEGTLIGPLHSGAAFEGYVSAVDQAKREGGEVLFGGQAAVMGKEWEGGHWVEPTMILYDTFRGVEIVRKETFAPILHITTFDTLEEAIEINNSVEQGLSSALFTQDMGSVFQWIGPEGSDCGIVNVNGSTSGAEVGGRFGGNKSTGWGRESGGDAWKQYCRWSTATINWSNEVGMAQGVVFE